MWRAKVAERIVDWLKDKVYSAGGKGAVFGLSGGIDSALVAALCSQAFAENNLAVIMPCYSSAEDRADAYLVADKFKLKVQEVVLDEVFKTMLRQLGKPEETAKSHSLAAANIKPRLRMITLYYFASIYNYLVIGTGNKSEIYIGYFTKYGDGGADLEPIAGLLKDEVRELARFLGVPDKIIEKEPTAGLWQGQTDEKEMGFSYEELDKYIRFGREGLPLDKVKRIEHLHLSSEHKRAIPPVCPVEDLI
ncbi:MAG: NAD(+) synthase [Firmicutes bacterium]|nr:NAD(+) synthase [Bacillota bacterium]